MNRDILKSQRLQLKDFPTYSKAIKALILDSYFLSNPKGSNFFNFSYIIRVSAVRYYRAFVKV